MKVEITDALWINPISAMMPQHSGKGCKLIRPAASRLLTFRWGRSTGCCQAFYGNDWGRIRGVYDNKSLVTEKMLR